MYDEIVYIVGETVVDLTVPAPPCVGAAESTARLTVCSLSLLEANPDVSLVVVAVVGVA